MSDASRFPAPSGPPPAASGPSNLQESALRELLRSPLDDEPRPRAGRGRAVAVVIFTLAAMAGAGLTAAGAALVRGEEPAVTTAAAATTATTAASSGPALPAGYYPAGAGFGARAERVLVRPDAVFVTLSFAVDEEHDPESTPGHQGGQWQLEFPDGAIVRSTAVAFDPIAPATATITFPAFSQDPATATLHLVAAQELHTAELTATVPGTVPALPPAGAVALDPEPASFALGGGATLHLGSLLLEAGGGSLDWAAEGAGAVAHLAPGVILTGPDGEVVLSLADPFSHFRNRALSNPPPVLAAAATAALIPLDPTRTDPGAGFRVTIALEVTWATPLAAEASLPLTGAQVIDVRPPS